jgi:carboxypeptidase Q
MIKRLLLACLILTFIAAEKDYTSVIKQFQSAMKSELFKHSAYDRLAYISDTYGPRMWGSKTLETVIEEMANMAEKEGFDNVHLEPVRNFTKWIRGKEELIIYSPRPNPQKLDLIGLGDSISG